MEEVNCQGNYPRSELNIPSEDAAISDMHSSTLSVKEFL